MPKVWNIGNTTVRNPKRIETALAVFVEEGFSGNAKGTPQEKRLHAKLGERQVLEFEGEPKDFAGRKWRAAFYQLGFITFEKYKLAGEKVPLSTFFEAIGLPELEQAYQLTPAGERLIQAGTIPEIEEIYTRQFVCHEIPNALETGFPEGKMKPFLLFVQVLNLLQEAKDPGLSKLETAIFLQKFRDHTPDLPGEIVAEIKRFRQREAACQTPRDLKALYQSEEALLEAQLGIKAKTPLDYADTTFRYFSLSGMFTRVGSRIEIRPEKRDFVKALLDAEAKWREKADQRRYFKDFYQNSQHIPVDDVMFAVHDIRMLALGMQPGHPLLAAVTAANIYTPAAELRDLRFALIDFYNREKEEDYTRKLGNAEESSLTLRYLRALDHQKGHNAPEFDDRPAYLEWAVWRAILGLGETQNPVQETRRFPVDQDFLPRNTAPGGGSDLLFEFEEFVLVGEVTLTTSHRQMAAESEPVRRHTVQYQQIYAEKDVYCLFIAPEIDNNIAESFRIGVWYDRDAETFVNIVPMTLGAFIGLMESTRIRSTNDLRNLLDRCLVFRNVRAPQWLEAIDREVRKYAGK